MSAARVSRIAALTTLAIALCLVGWRVIPALTPTSMVCVSWVGYTDEADMAHDADLVVEGIVGPVTGTVDVISGRGDAHSFVVTSVRQGELNASTITVVAPRDWCTANPPQPADPLREGDAVVLYLYDLPVGNVYSTLTPFDGVIPLDPPR
jgi:hypothetical protein